ncbi:MAG: TrbG/VirB9 family P-type conjugative transfer protein [Betaproteobacteria bacterium]|nr:TrbG/VirB9 family P-type conjugative transfer protein [Betaproteobacteria bacterium]
MPAADQVFDTPLLVDQGVTPTLFNDTRVVAYEYDSNRTYPIKARVKVLSEIAVPDHEKIIAWYPSADEKRGWPYTISADKRHVFIMPMQAGTVNTATLLTDKRSYLLTFEAANTGIWFQRVSWIGGDDDSAGLPAQYEAQPETVDQQNTAPDNPNVPGGSGPDLQNMFVDYAIQGDEAFTPTLVADDGKFTWFRLPPSVQELPALFVLNDKKESELVNYTVDQNGLMKAQRTANAWLLKLGDEEVRVTVKPAQSKSWFGWLR